MEESIAAKIMEGLAKERALNQLEKAAQDCLVLQTMASHVGYAFVKLCEELLRLQETYGREAYKEALDTLGMDENTVKHVTGMASTLGDLPSSVIKRVLSETAHNTIKKLELFDAGSGQV